MPNLGLFYSVLAVTSAGVLEQSMGARNQWGCRTNPAGEIDSLESIPGLLNVYKFGLCILAVND